MLLRWKVPIASLLQANLVVGASGTTEDLAKQGSLHLEVLVFGVHGGQVRHHLTSSSVSSLNGPSVVNKISWCTLLC